MGPINMTFESGKFKFEEGDQAKKREFEGCSAGTNLTFTSETTMVSNICTKLLNKMWRPYEVEKIPHIEGIYVIGVTRLYDDPEVIYVGRSNNIHRRMVEHKRQDLHIDDFIQQQFEENDGENLVVKWIKDTNQEKTEMDYIKCIANKVGYWPKYNIKH